tara:strand:+ start:3001 stop:3702 length:702 start_codon:yes stop_codon:yes gene_type:complete
MLILIPPSEGKTKVKSTGIRFEKTNFQFEDEVKKIVFLLENLSELGEDLSSIYGTSQEKSELFHRQNQDVFNSRCAMAIERYTGVVYEHINWDSMSDDAKKYMIKHIRIFSGLFGMVAPDTLIPNYKLKMNVLSLQNQWNPILTKALSEEKIIFDLLPQVHRKAYKPSKNVIKIDFVVRKKGKKTAAGHYGKAVKGEFIKFLAENNVQSIEEFSKFEYDGFTWDGEHFLKEIN